MSYMYKKIYGADGLFYGYEWRSDAFDSHVNDILKARGKNNSSPCHQFPRVALDIGCGTGLRAGTLAQLGLFDKIIAVDIADRSTQIAKINQTLNTYSSPHVPIEFRHGSASELDPAMFDGTRVEFVNFRRVAHFLAPFNFYKSLSNIAKIAATNALVAISFDKKDTLDLHTFFDSTRLEVTDRELDDTTDKVAPYRTYNGQEVESLAQRLGFCVEPKFSFHAPDNSGDNEDDVSPSSLFRQEEHAILAIAPGMENATLNIHIKPSPHFRDEPSDRAHSQIRLIA